MNDDQKSGNRTVNRTVIILDYITRKNSACSIVELSKQLGIPKSSVFDIVHTLKNSGLLCFNDKAKEFSLGPKTYTIGMAYFDSLNINSIVFPYLQLLSQEFHETAYFAIPNGNEIIYIDKIEGNSPLRTTCTIGNSNNMYSTGLGKAMLAAMTDIQVAEMYKEAKFIKKTQNTVTSLEELLQKLHTIRTQGYSTDNEEDIDGIFCIAAPILNFESKVEGAISVSMFHTNNTITKSKKVKQLVCEYSIEISRKLGYINNSNFVYQESLFKK